MGATLYIGEEGLELGATLAVYKAVADAKRAAGKLPAALDGLLTQLESQEPGDPAWLKELSADAASVMRKHSADLAQDTQNLLENLAVSVPKMLSRGPVDRLKRKRLKKGPGDAKKTVAVDFDRVLSQYTEWTGPTDFGEPIPGAREFMEELNVRYDTVVHSTRLMERDGVDVSTVAAAVAAWLEEHSIPYTSLWTGRGKPLAIAYIDDRAVHCDPQSRGRIAYEEALEAVRRLG